MTVKKMVEPADIVLECFIETKVLADRNRLCIIDVTFFHVSAC